MRFKLRSLMIVLALGPPLIARAWFAPSLLEKYREWRAKQMIRELLENWVPATEGGGLISVPADDPPATPFDP